MKSTVTNQYTIREVKALLEQTKGGDKPISLSTFYRLARSGVIRKYLPEGQAHDATYDKRDVDELIMLGTPTKRRNRPSQEPQTISMAHEASSATATDWIQLSDKPYVYVLDCELYGIEKCLPPHITWTWWQKNPFACRILFNKANRRELWGALSIIPMEEEIILKLLRGEMEEKDIKPEHVLAYRGGEKYSCYVAAVSIRPERRMYFGQLLHSFLAFWCEQYPSIEITNLFGFVLGDDDGDKMRMIRTLFFGTRYDIGGNAWELRLNHYNPDPMIQSLQKCYQVGIER